MGLPKLVYYLCHLIGLALMCAVTLRRCEKTGVPRRRGIAYVAFTFSGGMVGAMLMGRIYTAAAHAAGETGVSFVAIFGAVMFTPLLLLPALYMEKRRDPEVRVGAVMDLITPGSFLVVICGKLGCFLHGCCWGVPCGFGVYNPLAGMRVFPVQLCEALTMPLVLLAVWRIKKSPRYAEGMEYPLTAALYAVLRFGWEYLRAYPEAMRRLLLGMTLWQFCCVAVFAVSAAAVLLLYRRNARAADGRAESGY